MRLALLLFNMPISKISGSCRYVRQIADELVKAGHDVTVIANKEEKEGIKHKFRLIEVDTSPYGSWGNCLKDKVNFSETIFKYLTALLSANEILHFELIHTQHLLFSTLVSSLFKDITGVPFVATCHGTEIYESSNHQDMLNFFKFSNDAELITSASETIVEDIVKLTKFDSSSIQITYPGVDTNIFKFDSRARSVVRSRLGFVKYPILRTLI